MEADAEESGCYTYALQRWLFVGKGVPLRLVRTTDGRLVQQGCSS
jgi:hypothetical protein